MSSLGLRGHALRPICFPPLFPPDVCASPISQHPQVPRTGDFISWAAPGSADPLLLVRREAGPGTSARPVLELLGSDMGVAAVWMIRGGSRFLRSSGGSPRDTTAGGERVKPETTRGLPRAGDGSPRRNTHRPSASSCPHCHPGWMRRNQAPTQTWWRLPRVGEQWAVRAPVGQNLVGGTQVSLSPHAHTTYRLREPATTARDMHWHRPDHAGMGPRAPQGPQPPCLPPATPQRRPRLIPEPATQPAWLGLAPGRAEGRRESEPAGGCRGQRELGT